MKHLLFFLQVFAATVGAQEIPGRTQMAATFDSDKNILLVFGGSNHPRDKSNQEHPDNKLWSWNGRSWKVVASDGPSWREDAKMVYCSRSNKVYLFGGRSYDHNRQPIVYDETWMWDGANWKLLAPKHSPGKTLHTNMVYDPGRDRIVMFGGAKTEKKDGPPFVNEVWEFDGDDWKIIGTEGAPTPRIAHSMTYSPALKKVLVVGGVTLDGTIQREVWTFDGRKFELIDGNMPEIEAGPGNVVNMDSSGQVKMLLFGRPTSYAELKEVNPSNYYGETWLWSGKDWTKLENSKEPTLRENHTMFYDQLNDRVILFGGSSRAEDGYKSFNEVWLFSENQWKIARREAH
jgi:hypothetical protein